MGIKVDKDHWVTLSYQTEKGLLFTWREIYQSWFPRSCCKSNIELYDNGKLSLFILPSGSWILNTAKTWDTRRVLKRKAEAKKIPYNQSRLFGSTDELTISNLKEKQREMTRKSRARKKAMKRMRDEIGRPEHKFKGN